VVSVFVITFLHAKLNMTSDGGRKLTRSGELL